MTKESQHQSSVSIEDLTYEMAIKELEQVIGSLEKGDQTLEESLALFERGKKLSEFCLKILEQAERKVKLLSGEEIIDFHQDQ